MFKFYSFKRVYRGVEYPQENYILEIMILFFLVSLFSTNKFSNEIKRNYIAFAADHASVNNETNLIDNKIDSLLSKMTLREKIGQMTQINLTVIAKGPNKWGSTFPLEIDHESAMKALVDYKVGSILNTINNTA